MNRRAVIFIGLFLWFTLSLPCAGQIDSTRLKDLDKRLERYFQILEPQGVGVKIEECDLLIDSAKDSVLRRHIALKAYEHYLGSALMGDESVAVHITDTWFASGLVSMGGEDVLLNAKLFADFNRQSLLGEPAPSFTMESFEGDSVTFGGPADRYRVLLFYDTDCAKCKLETALLRPLLDLRNWPVDLYAVYTGSDRTSWRRWFSDRMNISAPRTRTFNLWDPEVASDYQMKYGVLQTPRMFLIDKDGIIIGRGLDSDALERLLDMVLPGFADYEYGGVASAALMDTLFASYDESALGSLPHRSLSQSKLRHRRSGWLDKTCRQPKHPCYTRILSMAKVLEDRTLSNGDTLSFKHLEGDLLYWLTSRRDEFSKEGTLPFINEYILSRPGIWSTSDDTLKVVGLARMMKDLLSRTPVGSRLPKAKDLVPDFLRDGRRSYGTAQEICSQKPTDATDPISGIVAAGTSAFPLRGWAKNWDRLRRKGGFIVFHTEGCPVCKAELLAADSLGLRILDVNVDEIMVSNPDLAKTLLDAFDLSSMPFILEVDRHGIIRRRYISFLSGSRKEISAYPRSLHGG